MVGRSGRTADASSRVSAPFLVLQARPEDDIADDEFAAILSKGGLGAGDVIRVRLERDPVTVPLGDVAGIILGGGPGCVSDPVDDKSAAEARIEARALALMPQICGDGIPFLGCCYGMGILAHHLGARVGQELYSEPVGVAHCRKLAEDPLLDGLPEAFDAFVGHKEAAEELPRACTHLVSAPDCPYQMLRFGQNVYATQFHPEADGDGFVQRIEAYRHKGYFPPNEADALVKKCRQADVRWPARILANFVDRYRDR